MVRAEIQSIEDMGLSLVVSPGPRDKRHNSNRQWRDTSLPNSTHRSLLNFLLMIRVAAEYTYYVECHCSKSRQATKSTSS